MSGKPATATPKVVPISDGKKEACAITANAIDRKEAVDEGTIDRKVIRG